MSSAAAIPPPNPDNPLSGVAAHLSTGGLIAVTWVCFAVAFTFVALRCYARITESKRLFPDDYWVLLALFFLLANAILQTLQTPSLEYLTIIGANRVAPGPELFKQGNIYVRYEFAIVGMFWTITWCIKASFLTLYWRLFDGLPVYRRWWWAVVVFCPLAYASCWISSAWTCHPPSSYFHFGKCMKPIDNTGSVISISFTTSMDILTDLMIMVLPLGLLPGLQINRKQKAGLAGIFCVGFIVIVVAIIRLTQIVGKERNDPFGLAVWSIVESTVSVIVGSLPALKSLLSRAVNQTFKRKYADYPSSGSGKRYRSQDEEPFSKRAEQHNVYAIPLQDQESPRSNHFVSHQLPGQIVVQKEYGWSHSEPEPNELSDNQYGYETDYRPRGTGSNQYGYETDYRPHGPMGSVV